MATSTSSQFIWRGTAIVAQLEAAIEAAMEDTAHDAETIAKSLARVDTGEMREGLHADVTGIPGGLQMTLTGDSDHTIFNELGTSRMSAQPMMRPAIDQAVPRLPGRVRAHVGNIR
jgi:HK97 gp10 family phage protein